MKPYRGFSFIFLGVAGAGSLFVIGFNVAIDPFGIMNSPDIRGVNRSKPQTIDNSRLYKAVDLTRKDVKMILLGASRVEEGLNPEHTALQVHKPVYNLALPGGTFYEQRRYLEHAIATQKNLETVILGIDLWLLAYPEPNRPGFNEARLEKDGLRFLEGLEINLSWDTLTKSLETFNHNRKEPDTVYYHPNGVRDVEYLDVQFTHFLPFIVNKKKNAISPGTLENLIKIRDLCQENGIDLKAFITPPHAIQFEGKIIAAGEEVIEERKRAVVEIMPVWDFSGYNSITTEPINSEMTLYRDSSHFTFLVGDMILKRILAYEPQTVPEDFGIWITSGNIEEHLATVRQNRRRWIIENSESLQILQSIKR